MPTPTKFGALSQDSFQSIKLDFAAVCKRFVRLCVTHSINAFDHKTSKERGPGFFAFWWVTFWLGLTLYECAYAWVCVRVMWMPFLLYFFYFPNVFFPAPPRKHFVCIVWDSWMRFVCGVLRIFIWKETDGNCEIQTRFYQTAIILWKDWGSKKKRSKKQENLSLTNHQLGEDEDGRWWYTFS